MPRVELLAAGVGVIGLLLWQREAVLAQVLDASEWVALAVVGLIIGWTQSPVINQHLATINGWLATAQELLGVIPL